MVKSFLLVLLLSTSACSWVSRDGAPAEFPDVSDIADAQPYVEPTSKGGNPSSYVINGIRYFTLKGRQGYSETGIASWYGTKFHGRLTSNGERYDMYQMTAAHKTLPIPTYVTVTNLENDESIMVRVNDRGPFVENRIIDLSYVAAIKLGITEAGTARVRVDAWTANSADMAEKTGQTLQRSADTATAFESELVQAGNRLYYLQLGSFANHRNAQKLVSKLLLITEEPVKITRAQTKLGMMYRVRLGPYELPEKITAVEKHFSQLGFKQQSRIVEKMQNNALKPSNTITKNAPGATKNAPGATKNAPGADLSSTLSSALSSKKGPSTLNQEPLGENTMSEFNHAESRLP